MSSIFEDPTRGQAPRPERPGWARGVLITAIVMLVLFFAMSAFTGFWTERLWFGSVGYSGVFTRLVVTKTVLFLVFGALLAAVVVLNMVLAYRTRPRFRPASPEQIGLDRYRQAIDPIRLWVTIGVGLVVGAFAGASGSGMWRDFLLWRNGTSFGRKDPYFKKDIGFYVFDLPWLHHLVDFAMAVTVVSLLAAVLVHYLYGGIRLQATRDRLSGAAAAQISVLLGFFVLAKAADYWLDRYDLLNASGGLVTGITYTDDHAVLPAKTILMSIALICAALFFANVIKRTWMLPSVGLGLLLLSAILLGVIWPGAVQQFQVNPSQSDKEPPYIQRNIEATRAAYDIADAKVEPYGGESQLTSAQRKGEVENAPGIRLVDPKLIQQAFEQQQQLRRYYSVAPVLDVDRYVVNGEERDVVLGVREIDQSGMTEDSKNWSNLHTVYTHGYGVVAAYGNQRNADGVEKGLGTGTAPEWAGVQGANAAADLAPDGYRAQVYFGEKSPEYSIVGKASKDARDVELDQPSGEDTDSTSTYDGKAGVGVGGLFRKLLYAWKYGEPNILLSERVYDESKILYDRDPSKMVEKVAPWLTVDRDPFPAIVDGKVVWLLDGYTTTDQYPLSQRASYQDMITDSLANPSEFRTLPTDEINYMRNAVKAVVDAYDGTVTLYAWDEKDPLLKAWRASFPGTVKDKKDIPANLLEHMRYPEDMFKVQRYQLARYHVTDADTFYEDTQRWEVPTDPTGSQNSPKLQPPYRLSVRSADPAKDGAAPVFSLTSTYVPYKKQNLAAFVSVDGDASRDSYGTIRVLELPTSGPVKGPRQIANDFSTDAEIQKELQQTNVQTNVHKVYGNLLTLPVGDSLLYVQPLYTQREGAEDSGNFPVLNFVLVSFGDRLAIGRSMSEAIAKVLGAEETETPTTPGGEGEEPALGESVIGLLQKADDEFAAAKAALAKGDLAGYAEHTEAAERFVNRALAEAEKAAEAKPAKTPAKAAKTGS
ncbi:UPF0182 family protein [Nocardioides cavernaquae]|uniref:UPF0182 protein D4739_10945 n=1 Tax=Nocardioides cavernaquae TaxID=2321396 RepID=A0A3A5H9H3_9ACTN|nr:UPF0182 family protein [Nocardioides cavernaquae]RJS46681.1 UPF0182 family protein [Nocardioides cavernaquae]